MVNLVYWYPVDRVGGKVTLTTEDQFGPVQRVFALAVRQGLTPSDKRLPAVLTVDDVRRLRTLVPRVWTGLSDSDKWELYDAVKRTLLGTIPPWGIITSLPASVRMISILIKREGSVQGAMRHIQPLDQEMKNLQQDVLSLWENDQMEFQARLEMAVASAESQRGTRMRNSADVKAALDSLF